MRDRAGSNPNFMYAAVNAVLAETTGFEPARGKTPNTLAGCRFRHSRGEPSELNVRFIRFVRFFRFAIVVRYNCCMATQSALSRNRRSPESGDTFLPDQEELDSLQKLASVLTKATEEDSYFLVDEKTQAKNRLPRDLYKILLKAIIALSEGRAISVTPLSTRLTTQQAADFLGISRPTLVRLLDEGEIPYSRPRRHRQVLLADLLEYNERQQYRAAKALDEIMADTARMGFYDEEFARPDRPAQQDEPTSRTRPDKSVDPVRPAQTTQS